ncbi:MAG TPA: hypothetical protein VNW28_05185 [Chthoniobacterales bacterium]|nr:hypothetical protein [Chthoniobacterales bacterium]
MHFSAAPIDDHTDASDDTAVPADDVDRFLHAAAAAHNILRDDEFFVRRNHKSAAQDEAACFLLGEEVAFA